MEEYRDIPGYEGLYSISNYGNVWSHKTNKVLKPGLNGHGYLYVNICKDSAYKSMRVHQLVAMAFLDHVPNGMEGVVDHIDNDGTNNHVSNLQIVTQRQNSSKDRIKKSNLPIGVVHNSRRTGFVSRIRINDKRLYLGTFDTPEEASAAYQEALEKIEQ